MRQEFYYPSSDGETQIHAIEWAPEGEVRAVLQICHGMQEHMGRYDEVMRFLAEHGYLACGVETVMTVIATVVALLFLVSVLGIGFTTGPNRTVLFSTVSSILLLVTFLLNILFAWLHVALPVVIIVNALAVIGWLFALYAALSGNVKNQKS